MFNELRNNKHQDKFSQTSIGKKRVALAMYKRITVTVLVAI